MGRTTKKIAGVIAVAIMSLSFVAAQISPGDLSVAHAHLEGISNCTQCHVLGDKPANEKCLKCHTEIHERIRLQKGYHTSSEVKGKQCFSCHSEHNGRSFQLIRLDIGKFNHNLTGYPLSVPHAKKDCRDCHNKQFITDPKLRTKNKTYLGTGTECLTCHQDYHRKTLATACLNCHNPDAFVPAAKFNHAGAQFQLRGKHTTVECVKCHPVEITEGKKFQQFRGIQFASCTNCHKDPHENKFGQNCRQCHTETSFQTVKGMVNFDHNKTNFKLEGNHAFVNCKTCHKTSFTDPLAHDRCTSCHADYHNNQFSKNGLSPDCSECHTVNGFAVSSFGLDKHNLGVFPLKGSHTAVPCNDCHKKEEKWNFKGIGTYCKDCHKDVHQQVMQSKYYPEGNCRICHTERQWSDVSFNHAVTAFNLTGAHTRQECRACHYPKDAEGKTRQVFTGLPMNCSNCHADNHQQQFEKDGVTQCAECHNTENWKATGFDHNNTAFKLDGQHSKVPCTTCHTPQQNGSEVYILYKIKEFKCESCHL
jgi:hypothetical protein